MNERLRIGILTDNDVIPAWSYKMLSKIKASSFSEIVLIVEKRKENDFIIGILNRLFKNTKYLVYHLYRRFDSTYYKSNHNAFESKHIKSLLNVDRIEVKPNPKKFNEDILDKELKEISKYNIDIFIELSLKTQEGNIMKVSKYGIWSLQFGNLGSDRMDPPGFWEVIKRLNETTVSLKILSEKFDKNVLLARSYYYTDNVSVEKSINNYHWKALFIIPRKINQLYKLGEDKFFERIKELNLHSDFYSINHFVIPSNQELVIKLFNFHAKRIKNLFSRLFYFNQWIILFQIKESETISDSFYKFKKIIPPKNRIWADPHVFMKDEKYYIFIEEIINSDHKGFISVIEMDHNGIYSQPVKVLEKNYHLSYPFIIEDKGEIYMIPESKQNNNIQLFKCTDFPYKWQLEIVLMDNIKAVDTTVIFRNNKYWLFTTIENDNGTSNYDELFLYSSDSLISKDWKSHLDNPIVSDVKNARPAGKLFVKNGILYRPSQNCSKHYGYGMNINQVLELNNDNYKEKIVDAIFPNWNSKIRSTHTINSVEKLTVIDVELKRRRWKTNFFNGLDLNKVEY